MSEPGSRRGRTHDAEGAREAILNAAEAVFAEHGFDGARIDAIAAAAGYNKSLIFQYFDDKLNLYSQVIRRADDQTRWMYDDVRASLVDIDLVVSDFNQVSALLRKFISAYFDYMIENPRIMRIFLWEMAEGWQTYSKIVTQRDYDDVIEFGPIFSKMQSASLFHTGVNPMAQLSFTMFACYVYLALLPMLVIMMPEDDFTSPQALAKAKDYLIEFIIRGLLVDPSRKGS